MPDQTSAVAISFALRSSADGCNHSYCVTEIAQKFRSGFLGMAHLAVVYAIAT